MSRKISTDGPLSPEDRAYLQMRSEDGKIAWFDSTYPPVEEDDEDPEDELASASSGVLVDEDDEDEEQEEEDDEDPDYENWSVTDLKAEIERRNKAAGDDQMPVTGVKAELAKRLRDNDANA